jgi:hypothetical protein
MHTELTHHRSRSLTPHTIRLAESEAFSLDSSVVEAKNLGSSLLFQPLPGAKETQSKLLR